MTIANLLIIVSIVLAPLVSNVPVVPVPTLTPTGIILVLEPLALDNDPYRFYFDPDTIGLEEATEMKWRKIGVPEEVIWSAEVPPGLVVPLSQNDCETGGGCTLDGELGDWIDTLIFKYMNVTAQYPGVFTVTSFFTNTVSGYTITITDTLVVGNLIFLPTVMK